MLATRLWAGLAILVLPFAAMADSDQAPAAESLHVELAEVKDAGRVRPVGGVTSAGQPDAEALRVFADSGYSAVIDLRGAGESRGLDEAAVVDELGMEYVSLPIPGTDAVNFENAAALRRLIGEQDGPVLVHCGSGNRVGALLALAAALDGAGNEQALERGRDGGLTRLEPLVRQRLTEQRESN